MVIDQYCMLSIDGGSSLISDSMTLEMEFSHTANKDVYIDSLILNFNRKMYSK